MNDKEIIQMLIEQNRRLMVIIEKLCERESHITVNADNNQGCINVAKCGGNVTATTGLSNDALMQLLKCRLEG